MVTDGPGFSGPYPTEQATSVSSFRKSLEHPGQDIFCFLFSMNSAALLTPEEFAVKTFLTVGKSCIETRMQEGK